MRLKRTFIFLFYYWHIAIKAGNRIAVCSLFFINYQKQNTMQYNFNKLRGNENVNALLDEYRKFAEYELLDGSDGPVGKFNAISRACELCANIEKNKPYLGEYTDNDVANALDMALTELETTGDRKSTEFAHIGC